MRIGEYLFSTHNCKLAVGVDPSSTRERRVLRVGKFNPAITWKNAPFVTNAADQRGHVGRYGFSTKDINGNLVGERRADEEDGIAEFCREAGLEAPNALDLYDCYFLSNDGRTAAYDKIIFPAVQDEEDNPPVVTPPVVQPPVVVPPVVPPVIDPSPVTTASVRADELLSLLKPFVVAAIGLYRSAKSFLEKNGHPVA
jgi:hypothetical protein